MGQSSSQVVPSQVPASTQSFMSKITPWSATPKQSNKRGRPVNNDEEKAPRPKKAKHNNESNSPRARKPTKAVPQHRRGTSIRPQENEVELGASPETPPQTVDEIVVAKPASKNRSSSQHATTETPLESSQPKKKRNRATTSGEQANVHEFGDVLEVVNVQPHQRASRDESASNRRRVGQPGESVHSDGVAISPHGQPGPKRETRRKQKSKKAKPTPREFAQTETAPDALPSARRVRFDGVSVSAIGDPGPKRRKKPKLAPEDSQADRIAENEQQPDQQTWLDLTFPDDTDTDAHPKKKKRSRTKTVRDSDLANGVRSKSPSAIRPPTPSEGSDYVIDSNYDSNEDDSEHDEEYDATVRPGYVESTKQIEGWLDDQSVPDPATGKSKRSKKRQKPAKTTDQQEVARPGPNRSPLVSKPTIVAEEDTRPVDMRQYKTLERGTLRGPWTKAELNLADNAFRDFCQANNVHEAELRTKTTSWAQLGPFKVILYETFPKRSLENIRKHMQRRFSPYDKGQWNDEETQRLKDAYAKYPEQWPLIATEVERGQQACRERWFNQIKYEDTMIRGAWSIAEEAKLVKVVEAAVALIVESTNDPEIRNNTLKAEAMLHWADVASKMDGKRNQKHCMEKWKLLKRRSNKPQKQQSTAVAGPKTRQSGEKQTSRKQQDLDRQYAKMKPGDIYAALQDFATALNLTPNTDFHDESTFWSVIAQQRDSFTAFKSTPLIRRAYLNALVTYDCKRLRKAETYSRKVYAVMKKMWKLSGKGKLDLKERAFEDGALEPRDKVKRKKGLSKDVVHDSDEEAEVVGHADNADEELVVAETQREQIAEVEEGSEAEVGSEAEEGSEGQEGEEEQVAGAEEGSESAEEDVSDLRQQISGEDQDAASMRSETPYFTLEEFTQQCETAGKKQHRAYLKGYGR